MRRRFADVAVVAVLGLLAFGCRTSSPAAAVRLESLFSDLHARGLFDGAVVVSGKDGVLFENGYGYANVSAQVAFTPDTAVDGGSLAKTFTAALVIALHHQGALRLDAPAQTLLPELPYPEVTLRHLLSHSSGIPVSDYEYFDPYLPRDQVRTTEALLKVIAAQAPAMAAAPGTRFEYNSFGFDLAALAAARATGRSYGELLNERFLWPLGISSAFLRPGRLGDFQGARTLGYRRVDGKMEVNDVFDLEAFHGGSNLYISARDLDRWNRSFLERRLLTPAPFGDTHTRASIGESLSGLTLGSWYGSADRRTFWYPGHLQGFHCEVLRDETANVSVVYVSNNTLDPWLQKAIVRAVLAVTKGEDWQPLHAPPARAVGKDERDTVRGNWILSDGSDFAVARAGEGLSAVVEGVGYRMMQVGGDTFYIPGLDWMIRFSGGGVGRPTHVHVGTNLADRLGRRLQD